MSALQKAATQALEALEWADNAMYEGTPIQVNTQKAIAALRDALAEQPAEQESVQDEYNRVINHAIEQGIEASVFLRCWQEGYWSGCAEFGFEPNMAAYTAPQPAKREQEPVEIELPEYHPYGMGCGLEDRGITDRYEAMAYGWYEAIDRVKEELANLGPLYTAPQPAVAMPEGYALVPVEPTQAMLDAAGMCIVPEGKKWLDDSNRETWAAMLAAAPEAPQLTIPPGWAEAYAAFKGAFDMPLARRRDSSEYAQEARRLLREFNDAMHAATDAPQPAKREPADPKIAPSLSDN